MSSCQPEDVLPRCATSDYDTQLFARLFSIL